MSRSILVVALAAGCAGNEYGISSAPVDVHPDEVTECAFEAVDGHAGLSRYTCNPVFTTTDEGWAEGTGHMSFSAAPVLGHGVYQLWYTAPGKGGSNYDLGYAISADGTTWTPHDANPLWPERRRADWDAGWVQSLEVAWDPNTQTYRMLYGGITEEEDFFGIGVAGSSDGVSWELLPNNPVLSLGQSYAGVNYAWPLALDIAPGRYQAWLAGSPAGEVGGPLDMYRLRSDDGVRWDGRPQRVFTHADEGDWDDEGLLGAAFVELNGTSYLFYTGFGAWDVDEATGNRWSRDHHVGLATSADGGDTWKRDGKGPLPVHHDEAIGASVVAAEAVGNRIHVWVLDYYPELDASAVGLFLFEPEVSR